MYTEIKNMKLLLHKYFYNPHKIQSLIESFQNEFDLFSIDYDDTCKIIQMKIKKTSMKKIPNYNHSSLFYYSIISPIITEYFSNNLESIQSLSKNESEEYDLSLLSDQHHVSMLYSIIVIGDNIINIQL